MDKLKKIGFLFIGLILNLIAGGVIYYFWQPFVSWYFNYRPILGIDFYNLASYVGYLSRHFVWQFNGWKYIWWAGGPLFMDYPTLHAYLILPLLHWFSLVQSIQLYLLGTFFLFLFFSYLVFSEISQDRVLAVVLTIASCFSIGLYGGLVWGGSTQYVATQFFLPFTLWLLIKFFKTNNKRWFYLSALLVGLSFLGHPQVAISYILPITFLLLLTYPLSGEKYLSLIRIKRIINYFFIAVLAGYPAIYVYLGINPLDSILTIGNTLLTLFRPKSALPVPTIVTNGVTTVNPGVAITAQYNRQQIQRFWVDTHQLLFIFLAAAGVIFLITWLLRKHKRDSLKTFVFCLPALWVFVYGALLGFNVALQQGGWFRVFWTFPLGLGMVISFVWGDFWTSIKERLSFLNQKLISYLLLPVVTAIIVFIPAFSLFTRYPISPMFKKLEAIGYRVQSSALPDSLNVYIDKKGVADLKKKLVPSWLNPNDKQYRLFEADQRVNIWWNALFDMPLVKGYIEFPPGDYFTGVYYWTSIALTQAVGGVDALVKSWDYPREIAYNNALWLCDWLSIKYIEAEHISDSYNPLTSYLAQSDIFTNKEKVIIPGWAQLYAVPNGQPIIWHPQEDVYLTYYQIKDELVSPIAHTTNAPVIGVIGRANAYLTLLRGLAAQNLNSKKVIPVQLGEYIDDIPYEVLKDVDALILYSYNYRNYEKVWNMLDKYVKTGGKILIETGSDVKETDSKKDLPAVFPIKITNKTNIGTKWQLTGDSSLTQDINLSSFGPPMLDNKPWLLSMPNSLADVRANSQIILSANNNPLIVSFTYGSGQVIWSGMNLPYHLSTYKNPEEAKLWKNLLMKLVDLTGVTYGNYSVDRPSPNKMVISGNTSKGAIFRENSYPGWTAKLTADNYNTNLRIYRTGPTYWGFSYVKIPAEVKGPFTITFSYRGEFWVYFWTVIWLLTIAMVLDRVIFGSLIIMPIIRRLLTPIRAKVGSWWEKEEDK